MKLQVIRTPAISVSCSRIESREGSQPFRLALSRMLFGGLDARRHMFNWVVLAQVQKLPPQDRYFGEHFIHGKFIAKHEASKFSPHLACEYNHVRIRQLVRGLRLVLRALLA